MEPPPGCVFVTNTMLGGRQLETHALGTAGAAGLPGADKYGQDQPDASPVPMQQPDRHAALGPVVRALDAVPRVPSSAFAVVRQIGSGAFGKVVLARTGTGSHVAIKTAAARKEATLEQEALVHADLRHPNIVALRAVIAPASPHAPVEGLVLDYCSGGSLAEALELRRGTPVALAMRLAVLEHVLAALEHMHARGLCHLDLKPCNVMLAVPDLDVPQTLRVADFGLSQPMDGTLMPGRYRGTLPYMAPELAINLRSVASGALDVWSVGVLMRELLTLAPPCASWGGDAIKRALRDGSLYAAHPPAEPPYAALMAACLAHDPLQRPRAGDLRQRIAALRRANAHVPMAPLPPLQRGRDPQLALPESLGLGGGGALRLPNSLGLGGVSGGSVASCTEPAPKALRKCNWQELNLPSSLDLAMSFSDGSP